MAKDLNSVCISGRLTKDCDYKVSHNGIGYCLFSIATNRRKKNGENYEDESNFFDVVYTGKGADGIHKYLVKGKNVNIQGELHLRRWEDENGGHSKVEIIANDVYLVSGSNEKGKVNDGPFQV